MDFKKILEFLKGKTVPIILVISVLTVIYVVTSMINQKTELQTYRVRCSLAEQALKHPTIIKDTETVTLTETKYVNLTDQEKQELCEQYDLREEYLNRVINSLQKTTTYTKEISTEKTEAIIPQEPPVLSNRKWSIGLLGINANGDYTLGIAANRDIGKALEINAGFGPLTAYAGLLYKF